MPVKPSYIDQARGHVFEYIREHLEKTDTHVNFTVADVYVVWFSKVLRNWKAMVSTTLPDGMYYEITHNGENGDTYIDAYKKFHNQVIPWHADIPDLQILAGIHLLKVATPPPPDFWTHVTHFHEGYVVHEHTKEEHDDHQRPIMDEVVIKFRYDINGANPEFYEKLPTKKNYTDVYKTMPVLKKYDPEIDEVCPPSCPKDHA
jgi:hypothetical protein